jgi:hypothetical protein
MKHKLCSAIAQNDCDNTMQSTLRPINNFFSTLSAALLNLLVSLVCQPYEPSSSFGDNVFRRFFSSSAHHSRLQCETRRARTGAKASGAGNDLDA